MSVKAEEFMCANISILQQVANFDLVTDPY